MIRSRSSETSRRGFLRASALGLPGLVLGVGATPWTRRPTPEKLQERRPVTDTHIHLWQLPRNAAPMHDAATFPSGCCGAIPWLEQDALMARYNATPGGRRVDGVVLVESSVDVPPDRILPSNRWMLEQVASDEKLLSVVGKLDVTQDPRSFEAQLDPLCAHAAWVGLRIGRDVFEPDQPPVFEALKRHVLANLNQVAAQGRMVDTLGIDGQTVRQLADAVPNLVVVMDHVGEKPKTLDVEEAWRAAMEAAAGSERVYLKASDVHRLSADAVGGAWPERYQALTEPAAYETVWQTLWDVFGADHLIFGSNWPVSDVAGQDHDSIALQLDIAEAFLAGKGTTARDRVMHDNAQRVYGPRR